MEESSEQETLGREPTIGADIVVTPVTNFQVLPENGGIVLVLGRRHFVFDHGVAQGMPTPQTEMFTAAYMSHAMAKDLSLILAKAVTDFERMFGKIPLPGVDPEKPLNQ